MADLSPFADTLVRRVGALIAGADHAGRCGRREWAEAATLRVEGYNRMLWTALRRKAAYLPG
jgi:hypothetical protein